MSRDSYDSASSKGWELVILKLFSYIPGDQITRWLDSSLNIIADQWVRKVSFQGELDSAKNIWHFSLAILSFLKWTK